MVRDRLLREWAVGASVLCAGWLLISWYVAPATVAVARWAWRLARVG